MITESRNSGVVPFLRGRPGMQFQQDDARPHSARLTQTFLQRNNVDVMEWPALSPDLSPIEHLWDQIGRRLNRKPRNVQELEVAIQEEWNGIPQAAINRLIQSMRRRVVACISRHGGHTKY